MRLFFQLGIAIIVLAGVFSAGAYVLRPWAEDLAEYAKYGYVLPEYVSRRVATIDRNDVSFLIVTLHDGITWNVRRQDDDAKTVHAWRETLEADVVVNGTYFTESYAPAGFWRENGEDANVPCPEFADDDAVGYTFGVFIDDGKLGMEFIPEHPEFCVQHATAFASYPTLVKDGVALVEKNSGLLARRTLLAQTVEGVQQIIVSESGEVTLYDVAQWLLTQPEDYALVGNFDGGPSTGLSLSAKQWGVEVPSAVVPNVLWGKFE